ncbi:MAG: NAD(P)H-dependent oxidoreductase [Bacillota bacterium]|nr:NAD(P)H-dependent oxidoreductase [Bacillota bacterium]
MKVIILNGSPKVEKSITMQYVYYLMNKFRHLDYEIFNITKEIDKIQKDKNFFNSMVNSIQSSDLVIWAFPVFGLLVPADYKKFIEIIFHSNRKEFFFNKYTIALTTSIHFLDNYARYYINGICDDLNMKYLGDFFAHSKTLLNKKDRKSFEIFFQDTINQINNKVQVYKTYPPIKYKEYNLQFEAEKFEIIETRRKIVVISNTSSSNDNLDKMVCQFKGYFKNEVQFINLKGLIKKGCLECYRCSDNNKCVFDKIDGFSDAYFNIIREADIVVFADYVKDRYLSSEYKLFLDRCFVVNHQPRLPGKQVGYIVSGPINQILSLRHSLEAWCEVNGANFVGIVSDDSQNNIEIKSHLYNLAKRLVELSEKEYFKPISFEGLASKKIYRDEMCGELQQIFLSDHRYFKKNGYYDFPNNNLKLKLINYMIGILNKIPIFRKWLIHNVHSIKIADFIKITK